MYICANRGPIFVSLMLSPELPTIPRGLSQAVVDNRSLRLELVKEIPELSVPMKVINSLIEEINSTVSWKEMKETGQNALQLH